MGLSTAGAPGNTGSGNHFSCSMTAVLLARVEACGGSDAVGELMRRAGVERSVEYLTDTANWICYDEAVALWRAGAAVTHHPQFARVVGEDAAKRLNGSSVAALLRSLGSPEAVYRQIAESASKFGTVSKLEAVDVGPGYAEIEAVAVGGFPRSAEHCAWTCGLLTQPTVLFGLPPATVEHEQCAAFGASRCTYRITWTLDERPLVEAGSENGGLQAELAAMRERLQSMFATAADLIGADDIDDVLARITDRAALEVRAPRYLLAVRPRAGDDVHTHHKGFDEDEVAAYAARILDQHPAALPESWLVVRISSNRRDYGRLLAMYEDGRRFFPQERQLLEVYGRYAASALDSATALVEAHQRYAQSSALLELARALAKAGTSDAVAQRLCEAVPTVVDCDRVAVYIWDQARRGLVQRAVKLGAVTPAGSADATAQDEHVCVPAPGGVLARMLRDPQAKPVFVAAESEDPALAELVSMLGGVAAMLVPLTASETALGLLSVSVHQSAERLHPNPDLLDRLSGVAAQATTALQNAHLLDQITHQALHDQLTGLANRLQFGDKLRSALIRARQNDESITLFYLDLDRFKPVNDEFGHDVGDDLLAAVGERLVRCVRAGDTVARLGGDEFAILVDAGKPPVDPAAFERRLERGFSQKFVTGGRALSVGASIGYASFPVVAETADGLLRVADAAMFEAKRAGRAGVSRIAGRR